MAVDLPASSDLTLIFERDDVHAAFAGHCCRSHDDAESVRACAYCSQLRLILVTAILEWKALCDLEMAVGPPRAGGDGP